MIWWFALVAVLVIGGLVVLAVARGAQSSPVYDDRPEVRLPADRPLRAEDLAALRFTTAARGYRMSEVDALLARLRAEMAEREAGPYPPIDPSDATAPLRSGDAIDPRPRSDESRSDEPRSHQPRTDEPGDSDGR